MKKFFFGMIVLMGAISAFFVWGGEVKKQIVRDTIYKDTLFVTVHDTVYYDARWLRSQFVIALKNSWKNYKDGYKVEYPEFMDVATQNERSIRVVYRDITMDVKSYDDQYDMTVEEKYEALNMSAVTKSVSDSSFLLAGGYGDGRLYFEKDIKLRDRTWMYLRVEFPREMTWAVDPLLHYVKDYQPFQQ